MNVGFPLSTASIIRGIVCSDRYSFSVHFIE